MPTGSTLLAQVHGGNGRPASGDRRPGHAISPRSTSRTFRSQAMLTSGQPCCRDARMARRSASWPIEIIPDHPPTVAFAEPPGPTARRRCARLPGGGRLRGRERQGGHPPSRAANPARRSRSTWRCPVCTSRRRTRPSYHDLSPHPWAGLPVEIRLVATDALGQTGESEPVRITLPERVFRNPVARAIIDQRKELVEGSESRRAVAEILDDLDKQPASATATMASFSWRCSVAPNRLAVE